MKLTQMEDAIRNIDHRLVAVEQILPTLATKDDIADAKRHTDVRFESLRDDMGKVAEGVASLATSLQENTRVLDAAVSRLNHHDTILHVVATRLTAEESARTERLARVVALAEALWNDDEETRAFLSRPHALLGDRSPLDVASTELGARRVEQLLHSAEHGLPL